MRVPRPFEIPAIIAATAVLSFTAVSGLQAAVNPPLAKLATDRAADALHIHSESEDAGHAHAGMTEAAYEHVSLQTFLPAAPASLVPPAAAEPAPAAPATPETVALEAAHAEGGGMVAPLMEPVPVQAAVPPPAAVVPAPAPVVPAPPRTAPVVPRPAAPAVPVPQPVPTPVSGMDYVWDQVFGSGQFPAPASVPKQVVPPAGAKSQGVVNSKVCPPGQAAKGKC